MRALNRNFTRAILGSIVLGFALAEAAGAENIILGDKRPSEFSQERIYMRNFHQDVLEEKRKRGASTMEIASMKETFQVMEAGVQMRTWADWTNYHHAIVLDPPVVFDIRTNVLMDFTTPASTCRSYLRAGFLRDHDTLPKNADPSETTRLKRSFINDVQTRNGGPRLALFTILLTAANPGWTALRHGPLAIAECRGFDERPDWPAKNISDLQSTNEIFPGDTES